ncbi:ATP-binding protein [Nonomuraea antimicrobica]
MSRLRRHLPGDLIEFHGAGYRLAVERESVDAHRFETLSREGRGLLATGRYAAATALLREGLALWRGPAFADVADAPFARPQAVRLEELRLTATEDLYEAELSLPGAQPVAGLRELVAGHPLRERARGLLMRALHAAGRQAEALAVYEEGRRLLAAELGADPSPELAALHLEILRGERGRTAWAEPPAQLTSFVGREEELARLAALRTVRLVTIVGPGGTGKTRLAVESTGRRAGSGDTGRTVGFVDLTLADGAPGQVAQAVLGALGLREPALTPPAAGGPDPADRLVAALADRSLVLVLDNCEHVIAEAATLTRHLLARCPGLTVLATSREPLGLTGEHLVPLAPLPLPPPGAREAPQDALAYPAVRLFADRASAVRQEFALTPGNLDAVLRICAALDGLPLAIELAAARVRTFGVAEIADRLAEHGRFRLLSRGDRTSAARHQTLHAVVEWSWSLLGAEEQALARRFAVFAGARPWRRSNASAARARREHRIRRRPRHWPTWSTSRWSRPTASGTRCSTPSACSAWNGWRRQARRTACAAPTPPGRSTSPVRPTTTSTATSSSPGWPACPPTTPTSRPPCAGASSTTGRRPHGWWRRSACTGG